MSGWNETSLAELELLAAGLREEFARNPQYSGVELKDVEWEIEKRSWRRQP